MQHLEQAIRERAYQLWVEEGCQDGKAEAHWLAAQREVLAASVGGLGVAKATGAPKKAPGRTASKKTRAA
ncbi:MAG: DUF2934 domain-containing protein [Bradyrhizobium sp.]|nr:DUF2934 domain-containing protein [Bradyrhizobium sp.]